LSFWPDAGQEEAQWGRCPLCGTAFPQYKTKWLYHYDSVTLLFQPGLGLAFQGYKPIPSKVCTDNRILEWVNTLIYFGYTLSYEGEVDTAKKLQNT